jgi:hypothetical protein
LRIAIMAAIKNVLSPISDARITPHDFKKPVKKVLLDIMIWTKKGNGFVQSF